MIIEVSALTGIPALDILSDRRDKEISIARQLYWKLLREKKGYTNRLIGKLCGRNHSAVSQGIKRVSGLLYTNDKLATRVWDKLKGIEG